MNDLEWLARNVDDWDDRFDSLCKDEKGRPEWFNKKFFEGKSGFCFEEWLSERECLQNKPDWKDEPEWWAWDKEEESKPDQEKDVLDERQKTYGDFSVLSKSVEQMEAFVKNLPGYAKATPGHREAAHMIIQKLVRAMNGDPHYRDSWHDISGYARLAEKECKNGNT